MHVPFVIAKAFSFNFVFTFELVYIRSHFTNKPTPICHKLFDIIKHYDGGPTPDTLCRITQMTSYGYAMPDTNTLYFKDKAQGNPDCAVPPAALKKVKPKYLFKYDVDGKLQQLGVVIFYGPGNGYD
jgi:hypothetical protein